MAEWLTKCEGILDAHRAVPRTEQHDRVLGVTKCEGILDARRAVSKRQEAKASQQRATGRDF